MIAAIPQLVATSRPPSVQMTVAPGPESSVLDLDDVKLHLRVSGTDEDTLIQSLIDAATQYAQDYQWSQLCTASFVQRQDFFPPSISPIRLQRNPLNLTTNAVVIQYIDTGGTTQTLDPTLYVTDQYIVPALVVPAYTKFWPTTRWHINDVTINYDAGYGLPKDVPAATKQAILLLIAQWYRNREATGTATAEIAFSVKALLDLNSYRTFY